ncbi:primosomal protein N' family DNA-binding protein [Bifidobacterium choloepi]|uniref:Primosomal protein N n=1 Tax=Bifidobacterium choloepi TaxID=2614131 RepID=A0A6I5MZW6_9BIFI|nr:primosomal protein N' [Bifidobacterium choloepi]NEG69395.1 primosomal protein N' [Bifidobacterium choloepi]
MNDAEQLALPGLKPRKSRRKTAEQRRAEQQPAADNPVARVALDVQATHLGQLFDYYVTDGQAAGAQPGTLVRVRFGGQRVNGIVWERSSRPEANPDAIRFIERVVSPEILVSESMRRDITAIADAYGGTRANILRLAVPPRVAWVEDAQRAVEGMTANREDRFRVMATLANGEMEALADDIDGFENFRYAMDHDRFQAFVMDSMPGVGRADHDLATLVASALAAGRQAVVVLPGMRQTWDLAHALNQYGLRTFAPDTAPGAPDGDGSDGPDGANRPGYFGDVAILSGSMPPAERYRAYLAVSSGQVRCAIGPRAAMYAPVEGRALFVVVDDNVYQHADGMMPYASARGVMRLRARLHDGLFVAYGAARSALSQWETDPAHVDMTAVTGPSTSLHPKPAAIRRRLAHVRWLNREELGRLADPSIGARIPHTAVRVLTRALQSGPVLLSIPQDGVTESLSCAQCLLQARCLKCTGPLVRPTATGGATSAARQGSGDGTIPAADAGLSSGVAAPRCAWCGAPAANWHCRACGGERLRVVRVGAAGTVAELRGLFRNVPMVVSSPHQDGGVVEWIADTPVIVVATPGAEPRVRAGGGNTGGDGQGSYRAVAILDAWNSLYARGIDARQEALANWMHVVALCAPHSDDGAATTVGMEAFGGPRSAEGQARAGRTGAAGTGGRGVGQGGTALLIGETDPVIAQSLMLWDCRMLAGAECDERDEAALPPSLAAAAVWGRRDAVRQCLLNIGVTGDGDWAVLDHDGLDLPAVLGPVPIAPDRTIDARQLEDMGDRIKAIVRVPYARRDELAIRLRDEVSRHVALREHGELRFQMDPKDLM